MSLSNGHFSILSYKRKTRHIYSSALELKKIPLYLVLKLTNNLYLEVYDGPKIGY